MAAQEQDPLHLRLAGVTRLAVAGRRGPKDAFLFDPHRLALPCWALALAEQPGPALLVTFDRHFDLVPPREIGAVPRAGGEGAVRALDEHARWRLDVRNHDHVLAAMEAGLVADALVLARASPAGAFAGPRWRDTRGGEHALLRASSLDLLLQGPQGSDALALVRGAQRLLLDVDLDCFTTPSDADPTSIVPWTRELIRTHLLPPGSEPFWELVLGKACALTFAVEPPHCGGVVAAHRLFREAAAVLFEELFGADLP